MMKIKKLYSWQMINMKYSLCIFYTIIYSIYILTSVLSYFIDNFNITQMGTSSAIFLFISGLVFYGETFRFSLANGVSRKTILFTQGIMLASISLFMTLLDLLNSYIFIKIQQITNEASLFKHVYKDSNTFDLIIWLFGIYLMCAILGHFLATLNYRMNKLLKLVVYIGVPVILLAAIPLIMTRLKAPTLNIVKEFFGNIIEYLATSPYNAFLVTIGVSAVLYFFSVLLVKKAHLKTV